MDIQMLGGSRALTQVYLLAKHDPEEPLVIGNGGFHCLTHFSLRCRGEFPKGITFAPGAMKNLQMLELICVLPWRAEEPNGGLNLGLENLPSLRHLLLGTNCSYVPQSHVEALEAATRKATDSHPNHPTLKTGLLGTTRRRFFPKYVKYQGYESFTSDATVHDPSSLSFCHITTTGNNIPVQYDVNNVIDRVKFVWTLDMMERYLYMYPKSYFQFICNVVNKIHPTLG